MGGKGDTIWQTDRDIQPNTNIKYKQRKYKHSLSLMMVFFIYIRFFELGHCYFMCQCASLSSRERMYHLPKWTEIRNVSGESKWVSMVPVLYGINVLGSAQKTNGKEEYMVSFPRLCFFSRFLLHTNVCGALFNSSPNSMARCLCVSSMFFWSIKRMASTPLAENRMIYSHTNFATFHFSQLMLPHRLLQLRLQSTRHYMIMYK